MNALKLRSFLPRVRDDDPELSVVNLFGAGIGDEGARQLAEALLTNTHVSVLYLGSNRIGPDGVQSLAVALTSGCRVETLHLSGNPITCDGAVHLARVINGAPCLRELYVTDCGIGTGGAISLAEEVKCTRTLRALYVGGKFDAIATGFFIAAARDNAALLELDGIKAAKPYLDRNLRGYGKARAAVLAWLCICRYERPLGADRDCSMLIARLVHASRGQQCWIAAAP